jgi:pimeloyl-ACP methyl ester carboxylesterase
LVRELARASIERCEKGRLVVFDEATHWVHHEQPERVNGLMNEFFRDRETSAAQR